MPAVNCYAIIPAAGYSRRMGAPSKLLLPWNDATVMDHVLRGWTESSVTRVVVVVRQNDLELQAACRRWPTIDLVIPERDPRDMKESVQLGLRRITVQYQPDNSDRWMLAPADLPTLDSQLINRLIEASRDSDSIVVPRFGDRRGHPVSFPWSLVPEVFHLRDDQGINGLVPNYPVKWLDLPAHEHPDDLDTPQDYLRLSRQQRPR